MTFLAIRYLLSRRKQTVLMLLGIYFGTAAYVTISGLMLGFREYLVHQLVNNTGHIHIQARDEFIEEHALDTSLFGSDYQHVFWNPPPYGNKGSRFINNPQSWYKRLENDPRVFAFSPQLSAHVVISNGKVASSSTLIGCDPLEQIQVTTIEENVLQGSFRDLMLGGDRLMIGRELQKKLGVHLHQNVMITLGNRPPMPFKIVGIFATGNIQSDSFAYAALSDVQKVNNTPNQVNEIVGRLYDHSHAAKLATLWSETSLEKIQSWDQRNSSIFDMFKIQDAIRFLSIGSIMIVACFGIYNVLNMTVLQKRRDIAILRSMGYTPMEILSLFFFQGLVLGITGAILGLLSGYFLGQYLKTVPFAGGGPMGLAAGHLMISTNPSIYIQVGVLALLSASLASLLPARAAGKMTPIEIIRAGAD